MTREVKYQCNWKENLVQCCLLPFFPPRIQPWLPLPFCPWFLFFECRVFFQNHFLSLWEFFFFSAISFVVLVGFGFVFVCWGFCFGLVPSFVCLPLSCSVFSPLTAVWFWTISVSLFPLGRSLKWKPYTPSPKHLILQRRSQGTEVSPCEQAAWQLLSPSEFSWGEEHLTFHSGSMWKKMINK